jgi:hypothetical protein
MRKNMIQSIRWPEIALTEEGRRVYREGMILRPNQEGEFTCWIDCSTEKISRLEPDGVSGEPAPGQRKHYEPLPVPADHHLGEDEERLAAMFPLERVRELLGPLNLHNPAAGHTVTGVVEARYQALVGEPVGVFAVRDLVDDKLLLAFWAWGARSLLGGTGW